MLHLVLVCLLVGQVPPPPVPFPPNPSHGSAAESRPGSSPQAQREWLLAHLIVDMQMKGQYDASKYHEIERMVNNMRPSQLGVLDDYYQQRKAQVEAWEQAQAEANLHRLEAYRDHLKRELAWKQQVYQQEQAITAYGSAPPPARFGGRCRNFYAAQAWPYSLQPYYVPYHYRRYW